jgi:hypothetical protein
MNTIYSLLNQFGCNEDFMGDNTIKLVQMVETY